MRAQQRKRILWVNELANRSIGELTTAISLMLMDASGDRIEHGLKFASSNYATIRKFLAENPIYFGWLGRGLSNISAIAGSINPDSVAQSERAEARNSALLKIKLAEIKQQLRDPTNGPLACVAAILAQQASGEIQLSRNALHLIANIRDNCSIIDAELDRINLRLIDKLTSKTVILLLLAGFFVSIPVFYSLHAQHLHVPPLQMLTADITRLQLAATSGDGPITQNITAAGRILIEIIPKQPAVFLALAIVLSFLRSWLSASPPSDQKLQAYEERFRSMGRSLRDVLR